jgi:hypothetical protein
MDLGYEQGFARFTPVVPNDNIFNDGYEVPQ